MPEYVIRTDDGYMEHVEAKTIKSAKIKATCTLKFSNKSYYVYDIENEETWKFANWKKTGCHWKLIKKRRETMNIKTVQRYETSDCEIFRDIKEAEEHERLLKLVSFLHGEILKQEKHHKDYPHLSEMDPYDRVKNAIMDNKGFLKKILFS